MPKQNIVVGTDNRKASEFLVNYFSDTLSVPTVIRAKTDSSSACELGADYIFLQTDWVDTGLRHALSELRKAGKRVKYFGLGRQAEHHEFWDGVFDFPLEEKIFRKAFLSKVPLPNTIKLLIVDDEVEISEMVQDYFALRTQPAFEIRAAFNGLEGFKMILEDAPHCLILDLKMPVRSGVDLYQDLAKSGRKIPTVIFIDSTTADDVLEVRKWGSPVFVEKGGYYSSMSDMLALVKKLVAFS